MHPGPVCSRLVVLARSWDDVEGRLKEAETLSGNVVIPALEELHYAGRRLVDLIHYLCTFKEHVHISEDHISNLIFEVEQNVMRARHDIVDSIVTTTHTYLSKLSNDVGETLLLGCFPKYAEMRGRIDEVNDFITLSREERWRRQEMYDDIYSNYLPEITKLFKAVRVSQPRIEAQIREDEHDARIEGRRQRWRDCIAVASVIFGLVGCFLAYWFSTSPVAP